MLSRTIGTTQDPEIPRLTKTQAAEILGISARTLDRWIAAGTVPAHKLGPRTVRIHRADLEALFADASTQDDGAA